MAALETAPHSDKGDKTLNEWVPISVGYRSKGALNLRDVDVLTIFYLHHLLISVHLQMRLNKINARLLDVFTV